MKYSFPHIILSFQASMGAYSFIVFIALVVAFGIFMHLKLPETKGKTYEQIRNIFEENVSGAAENGVREQFVGQTPEHVFP